MERLPAGRERDRLPHLPAGIPSGTPRYGRHDADARESQRPV